MRLTLPPALLLVILALLTACSGDSLHPAPTPAGQPQGKTTFVYLWNFP